MNHGKYCRVISRDKWRDNHSAMYHEYAVCPANLDQIVRSHVRGLNLELVEKERFKDVMSLIEDVKRLL